MSSAAQSARLRPYLSGISFGLWAAAIALAPTLTTKAVLAAPVALLPVAWWTLQRPERWVALFLGTALLLPPLPIAIGDSGPHICLLFAALGLLAGALWGGEWRISGVGAALVTLFAVLLASVAPAAWYSGGLAAAGSLARVGLFGISVYLYLFVAHRSGPGTPGLSSLYWIGLGSALFACVDFYFQLPAPAGYGPQFVWLDSGVYRRAQGFFYEASTLGNFCAFFLVMIAVAFSRPREQSPVSRPALALGGALFFAALVLSYSRASLVNVAIALAVLMRLNRRRLRIARLAIAAALAGIVTWQVFPSFVQMYWFRLSATAEYLFSATEGVLSGRVASWRTLLGWIAGHPWQTIFGIGYKTLPYTDYLGAPIVADNMYLSLLIETGIAGLATLIWLNVAILRTAGHAAHSTDPRRAFCGTWMLCFWAGEIAQMASGDLLTYWRVLPLYFFVLALAARV
jgi:hypothetical protein